MLFSFMALPNIVWLWSNIRCYVVCLLYTWDTEGVPPLYNPVIGSLPSSLAVAATHQIDLNPDLIFKTSPQISHNQWGKSVSIL